jgi:hypothetical protein
MHKIGVIRDLVGSNCSPYEGAYQNLGFFPEYAKTRTDAKAIEGGGLYKETQAETLVRQFLPKRN